MSQIKTGALISYATTAVTLLLGLLYTPWMIDVIGTDNYGLYSLSLSVASILTMDFGIGIAVSRFLSTYYAKGEIEKAHRYLGVAYKVYLAIAALAMVAFVVIYFNIDAIYASLSTTELSTFRALYIVMAMYSVISIPFLAQNSILISNEQFVALKTCTLVQKIASAILTIFALLAGMGVFALVTVNAIVNLSVIAFKAIYIQAKTKSRAIWSKPPKGTYRNFASCTGWSTVTQLWQSSTFGIMPSILGIVSGSYAIATFGIAKQLEGYVSTISDSLGSLFMPTVARLLESEKPGEGLTRLMIKVGRIQVYIVGLVITGFVCFGRDFISVWMGEGFESVWMCAILIIAPSLLSVPQQVGGTALAVSKHVKSRAKSEIVAACISIALGFLFGAHFGAIGGCIAISSALIFNRVVLNVLYRTRLEIQLRRFYHETYVSWAFIVIPLMLLGFIASAFLPLSGWPKLGFEVAVYTAIYCVACWKFTFNDYEKDLVKSVFVRFRKKRS